MSDTCSSSKKKPHQVLTYQCSRQGASHIREEKPCQDSSRIWQGYLPQGYSTILAVADGHGNEKYDLSQYGSEIAVNAIIELIIEYCHTFQKSNKLLFDSLKNSLPVEVTREWKRRVESHFKEMFSDENAPAFPNDDLSQASESMIKRYGTTLLFALQIDDRIICGQIGDGDIRIINKKEIIQPITINVQLFGNETYSLVSPDSAKLWQINVQTIETGNLILLSSDGLSNGFANDAAFDSFLFNLYMNVEKYGFNPTMEVVPSFLDSVSMNGSGDDVTLVLCWQMISTQQVSNEIRDDESRDCSDA
jgi:serine/threonine protein phosphatase PrpC